MNMAWLVLGPRKLEGSWFLSALQKVLQQTLASSSHDRLGMELHPLNRVLPVAEPNNQPVVGPGRHLELLRQIFAPHNQRVVACGRERHRQSGEDSHLIMVDLRDL